MRKWKNIIGRIRSNQKKCIPDCGIIHFYMKCTGMDQAFIFSGAGPNIKTLKQLLYGRQDMDDSIIRFAQMIKSGRNVTLDSDTK